MSRFFLPIVVFIIVLFILLILSIKSKSMKAFLYKKSFDHLNELNDLSNYTKSLPTDAQYKTIMNNINEKEEMLLKSKTDPDKN